MNYFFYLGEGLILIYFFFKIHKIKRIKNMNNVFLSYLIPFLICAAYFGLSFIKIVFFSVTIAYIFGFMVIGDIIFLFINLKREKKIVIYNYFFLGFGIIYVGVSIFLGYKVFKTEYNLKTDKTEESLVIGQITDSHLGSTFNGQGLKNYVLEMAKNNLDLLVITGDFVDDDTTKEDMIIACSAFSEIKTTYGVYYVFGNHDKGYFKYRDFDTSDLVAELIKNNVKVLEDEVVEIGEDYYLIGRKDKSDKSRKKVDELVSNLDENRYKIILDHQPNDYKNERGKADLVLSGHTHGGNIFPINFFVSAANDQTYGLKVLDNTTFIVSSGISDWALPFNNVTIQEYVIIRIN